MMKRENGKIDKERKEREISTQFKTKYDEL